MKAWFKGLILPFVYIVASLPFPVLYVISDLSGFLLQYIFRYRSEIIRTNLRSSFPEKNIYAIKQIERSYYRYMSDLSLETLKALTISAKEMKKRCHFSPEASALFDKLYNEKKNLIIVLGHFGNWEWAGSGFSLSSKYPLYVLYRPLTNQNMNALVYHSRTRLGTKLVAMNDAYRNILLRDEKISATAFIADQTPSPESAYWMNFLHQPTAVFKGTARIARKTGYPIVYVSINRVKRGYYCIDAELLVEKPDDFSENELTELHTRRLEKDINSFPELWLWSHRRWKHTPP